MKEQQLFIYVKPVNILGKKDNQQSTINKDFSFSLSIKTKKKTFVSSNLINNSIFFFSDYLISNKKKKKEE